MRTIISLLPLSVALGYTSRVPEHELTAVDTIEQAPERIRQHRTAKLVVNVVDDGGRPVQGAQVEVRQTRHD